MIDNDASVVDILRQVSAVRAAMRAIHRELWRALLLDKNCGLRSRDRHRREREWHKVGMWLTGRIDVGNSTVRVTMSKGKA
jgi:hypothetical protein